MKTIEIGRLLRASTRECVVGCQVDHASLVSFGDMLTIPINAQEKIFGLIYDIHIDDDGLVRQLATASELPEEVILDNRQNRNVPVEMSVLFIGFEQDNHISHLLPPHPPLSLDKIFTCDMVDLMRFTSSEQFGYLRHIINRSEDLPIGDLLAAHLKQTAAAHQYSNQPEWVERALKEVITMLRDDYSTLTSVLRALADAELGIQPESK